MKCRNVVEGKCSLDKRIKCNGRFSNEHKYCFCPNDKLILGK